MDIKIQKCSHEETETGLLVKVRVAAGPSHGEVPLISDKVDTFAPRNEHLPQLLATQSSELGVATKLLSHDDLCCDRG